MNDDMMILCYFNYIQSFWKNVSTKYNTGTLEMTRNEND